METRSAIPLVFLSIVFLMVKANLEVPRLDDKSYIIPGDITLGLLMNIHRYSSDEFCSEAALMSDIFKSEVTKYITDLINHDPDILPNITLGFQVLDDCQKDITALARAITFAERKTQASDMCPVDPGATSRSPLVGVVGPAYSRQAVMVSSFLGLFEIPVLGTFPTSDELSDKSRFQYFMRLVPPDRYQVTAMMDILDYFNWTYVSLVYSEGTYGENAGKHVTHGIKARGKCLAVSKRISSDADEAEMIDIIDALSAQQESRVIIIFLEVDAMEKFFGGLKAAGLDKYFVCLSGDGIPDIEGLPTEPVVSGTLFLTHPEGVIGGFLEYLRTEDWWNASNPWALKYWQNYLTKPENSNVSTQEKLNSFRSVISDVASTFEWSTTAKIADGILVYAHALHSLVSKHCPGEFVKIDNHNLDDCISGARVLDHMRNVTIPGYSTDIAFDQIGDAVGQFVIKQYMWNEEYGRLLNTVGRWNMLTQEISMNLDLLDPSVTMNPDLESICSKPCGPRQYYQIRELACCWDCKECRSNEIILNGTSCEQCPAFTWPDAETKTSCEPIEPYYLELREAMGLCIVCLSSLGILATVSVIGVYCVKRKNRLLKATSRELSVTVLWGCLVACCVAMLFVRYPDEVGCPLRQAGFHFAICMTYSPLLVKTSRIYRIFNAGRKGVNRPKFISSQAQMIFTCSIILIQLILLVILELKIPSEPELIMPFATKRYVEVTCSFTMTSFIPPLSYNMAVIATCGVLGFLTKKLPENFNDSRYIFVSISTTFFMWLVILPTYFTTFHSHHKAVLLSVCLLLNAFITLLCQFGTKIYAVFLVKDEKILINTLNTTAVDPRSTLS